MFNLIDIIKKKSFGEGIDVICCWEETLLRG